MLYAYVPRSPQIQMFKSKIYDRNADGDMDITGSADLVAHLSIRKFTEYTEREVFPYASKEHLLFEELMPIVRRRVRHRRQGGHPWSEMTDMEIMQSAGLYEKDVRTGKKGFNRAAVLLFGRDEIIQQAAPAYVTDCLLRARNVDRYDDRERVTCNLIQAYDYCLAFIRKHTLDPFFLENTLNISVRDHIATEMISNLLAHREFSVPYPARIIIERDRILAENASRPLRPGHVDRDQPPYPKNPLLARFFVEIGYADILGSGVRNLYHYTKIYSNAEPELIEGDIFKTIIPLANAAGIGGARGNKGDHGADGADGADRGADRGADGADSVELRIEAALALIAGILR